MNYFLETNNATNIEINTEIVLLFKMILGLFIYGHKQLQFMTHYYICKEFLVLCFYSFYSFRFGKCMRGYHASILADEKHCPVMGSYYILNTEMRQQYNGTYIIWL